MSDFYLKIIMGILLLVVFLLLLLTPCFYNNNKKAIKPKFSPKYPQDFLILEILEQQPELKLFRADIFSGGVTFEYKSKQVRATKGLCYSVLVDNYIVDDKIAEVFYEYLSNKYDCFTPKTYRQYSGMPLN